MMASVQSVCSTIFNFLVEIGSFHVSCYQDRADHGNFVHTYLKKMYCGVCELVSF